MEQKAACDNMIAEKNKLIHDFQQVVNQMPFFLELISWSELGVDEAGPVSCQFFNTHHRKIFMTLILSKPNTY